MQSLWMVPDCSVPRQVTNEIGRSHASITADGHRLGVLVDISQHLRIVENVNRGLIVQEDPRHRETTVVAYLTRDYIGPVLKELKVAFRIVEIAISNAGHKQCRPHLMSFSIAFRAFICTVPLLFALVTGDVA